MLHFVVVLYLSAANVFGVTKEAPMRRKRCKSLSGQTSLGVSAGDTCTFLAAQLVFEAAK